MSLADAPPLDPVVQSQPVLTVEVLENILTTPALLPHEKLYVFNRVVGEYAAHAVLTHLDEVERHERDVERGDAPRSWRSIDAETRTRYDDMLSVVRDVEARRIDEEMPIEWNWLTLSAMESLREAARRSDDGLVDVVGTHLERSRGGDLAWQKHHELVASEDRYGPTHEALARPLSQRAVTTDDVDRYVVSISSRVRHRYLEQFDSATPYLNEYAEAACRGERDMMYRNLVDLGRTLDPRYKPSLDARHETTRSIVATHTRPTMYDIIGALENGDFEDLLKTTVMGEDEFDELMSDAMEMYEKSHRGDEDVMERITTFMDTAERDLERPVHWRDSETRDLLREEQALRNAEIAVSNDPNTEPTAVELDENGLPMLTQIEEPDAPSMLEEVAIGYAAGLAEAEVEELEASGVFDQEQADTLDAAIDSPDAEVRHEAIERVRAEALRQEKIREQEVADGRAMLDRDEPSL